MSPTTLVEDDHSATGFEKIEGRNTADYLLRTAQQHHAQISAMADTKANILITVSSIVLTLALSRLGDPQLRLSLLVLSIAILFSLLLAVLAILPRFPKNQGRAQPPFNLLFFGHFATLPLARYREEMARVLDQDAQVYKTLVDDLFGIGYYLYHHKYKYLRWSYLFLLVGFLAACGVQVLGWWIELPLAP